VAESYDNLAESELPEVDILIDAEEPGIPFEPLPLSAQICSLLFVSSKPLHPQAIADATNVSVEVVESHLIQLRECFSEEEFGFTLEEVAGGFQFRSSVRARDVIRQLMTRRTKRLSRAAAETLAVIAYNNRYKRAEIEAIRGVDALPTLKTLLDGRLFVLLARKTHRGNPCFTARHSFSWSVLD